VRRDQSRLGVGRQLLGMVSRHRHLVNETDFPVRSSRRRAGELDVVGFQQHCAELRELGLQILQRIIQGSAAYAVPRLPNVPMPYCTTAVSPCTTMTSSISTPSSSARSERTWSPGLPVRRGAGQDSNLPGRSIFTVALSQPPAQSRRGPMAQISPYVLTPIPISFPAARAAACSFRRPV